MPHCRWSIKLLVMNAAVISIDVVNNTLTGAGKCVPLKHHQTAGFLAALVHRAERTGAPADKQMSLAGMTALWNTRLGTCEPDRTAMRRLLKSVHAGLQAAQSASRVLSLPRKATVGPWWLEVAAGERWQVLAPSTVRKDDVRKDDARTDDVRTHDTRTDDVRTQDLDGLIALARESGGVDELVPGNAPESPSLTLQREPAATLNAVAALVVADALARQAQYADAVAHLGEVADELNLSAEGAAVFELRKIRWLRRSGQRDAALGLITGAQAAVRHAHPQARGGLAAELNLLAARLSYDTDPTRNADRINFERLGQQIDQAGSPKLLWEVANLQALASRRKLQALMARAVPVQLATLQRVNAQANDSFGAALYWLAVADDAYALQGVLVNYAYHLQWPLQQQNTALVQSATVVLDVVKAWRLSQAMIEKFDLPEDSAWDFIMLADLWLGHSGARALMQTDWRLWPSQRSPAEAAFYERGVTLAGQTGDARQQVLALDRCAAFCKESGDWQRAVSALKERDDLMAQDAQLAAQVGKEVLWAGGGRDWKKA